MIFLFTCTATGCPNRDLEYRMIECNPVAECGGCHQTLIGTIEQEAETNE
jgi:hypothetical protein